jgi:hypothetical protein
MSAASVDPARDEPCSLLKWASEFFGFPIAKVNAQTMTNASARVIDNFCQQNAVRLIYFLAIMKRKLSKLILQWSELIILQFWQARCNRADRLINVQRFRNTNSFCVP